MRLIDADALIESLTIDPIGCMGCPEPEWLEELSDILDTAPTIEMDRPSGEWKPIDLTWGRSIHYCTNCEESLEVPLSFGKPMYDWCPLCGARMKGADGKE